MKFFCYAIALLVAPGMALAEEPKVNVDLLPGKLQWTSIAFRGNYSSLVWDGKILQYDKSIAGREQPQRQIMPSEAAWTKFWKEMDAIDVWTWNKDYVDKTTADGHSWSVTIERGAKKVRSEGRNLFPPHFSRFEKAAQELLGENRK